MKLTNIEDKANRMKTYLLHNDLDIYTSLSTLILNISEVCNRKCSFCPRVNGYVSPKDRPTFMPDNILDKIIEQTDGKFKGTYSISGFGEPTLHPHMNKLIERLNKTSGHTSVITNGFDKEIIKNCHADKITISVYNKTDMKNFSHYSFPNNVLFKKQYEKGNTFFNNRAGNVKTSNSIPNTCCYIAFMKLTIDTNGDILQCCSDWKREYVLGNVVTDDIWTIWRDKLKDDRINLIAERRNECTLCSKCDAPGNLYGKEFMSFWRNYYGENAIYTKK